MKAASIIWLLSLANFILPLQAEEVKFSGQLSLWSTLSNSGEYTIFAGTRYLPQLNYTLTENARYKIDFEASAHIYGLLGSDFADNSLAEGVLKPYRIWARYSTSRMEIRAGLQKINFGSAAMLRPLMWFDQIDPRDPLMFTDGVWGLLGRYYFLNNANIWLWTLYGNKDPKTWEFGQTSPKSPEFGARLQLPIPRGELGLTSHHRVADLSGFPIHNAPSLETVPETRFALDARWDVVVGLWAEMAWFTKWKNTGIFTNQTLLNAGTDYTFGIGNGLMVIFEQLFFLLSEKPFGRDEDISFSLGTLRYPISFVDNLSIITYYNWNNRNAYHMLTWNHQRDNISLYIMGFRNPQTGQLPIFSGQRNLYPGLGFQVMLVFNH